MQQLLNKFLECWHFYLEYKQWYLEYTRGEGIRFHFYICIMIDNWPILVWCKFDNPHSTISWNTHIIQLLCFRFNFISKLPIYNVVDALDKDYEA